MVRLDPVAAHLVKGVVHGVHHGVFLPVHRLLLQGGVDLVHGHRRGVGARPLPCFQIHLQIGRPELEALEIRNGFQLLRGAHHAGTAIGGSHQLEARVIAHGVLDLLSQVTVPHVHEVVVAAEHVWHGLDVGQGGEGGQSADGFAHDIGYAGVHALQHLGRGTQLCAAVQIHPHAAVRQFFDLLGEQHARIIGVVALRGVQRHFPAILHILVVCGTGAA